MLRLAAYLAHRFREDRGGAAVSFILALLIFIPLVAILVQYALLANAKAMLDHACATTARAALTALPDEREEQVVRAAVFSLTPLSPKAAGVDPEADRVYSALLAVGAEVPASFPERYSYAMEATEVSYPDVDGGPWIQVEYRFLLTVPLARNILASGPDSIAGVRGRFFIMGAKQQLLVSPARWEANYHLGKPGSRP